MGPEISVYRLWGLIASSVNKSKVLTQKLTSRNSKNIVSIQMS